MINAYAGISPKADIVLLKSLAQKFGGKRFLHVNSTKEGGGVAEILQRMTPILRGLGIETRWEVIQGDEPFFEITKKIHNALQGNQERITNAMWEHYYQVNRENLDRLDLDADCVFIHDPQPAPLCDFRKRGTWVFRCHIDVSNPAKGIYDHVSRYCKNYDGIIFSVARFARAMAVD